MNQKSNEQQTLDGMPTRVLLVEYTKDITDMLELILGAEGFIVQSVENGEKANGVAAAFKPHAALVDIGLPDINGYEVARRLRQQNPAILLIAYSGWVKEEKLATNRVESNFLIKQLLSPATLALPHRRIGNQKAPKSQIFQRFYEKCG